MPRGRPKKKTPPPNYVDIPRKRFKLAEHQRVASEMMSNTPNLALFYEAGTGKTMCVLDYLYQSFKQGKFTNALVICPASIVSTWESSIDKMIQFEGYTVWGISKMKECVTVRSFQRTYEKKERQIKHRNGEIETKSVTKIRSDIRHEWGAIIIDESQGLGSHSSVQTKIALELADYTENRYILSGTPVSGGGGQEDFKKLYGQLKFLDPDIWKNWKEFCEEVVTGWDFYNNPCRYDNEKCRNLMHNYGIVARLDQCYDMPAYTDTVIHVPLMTHDEYRDIQIGDTRKYGFELKNGGVFFIKLLELVSGFMLDSEQQAHEYPTEKLKAVGDIINGTDDKIVIFCRYRYSIDRVAQLCAKHGKTVIFDGRSTTETWREFQNVPIEKGGPRFLVCHYASGGTGLDLYASHTTIFYEPSFSSLLMEQAKARTRRKGQENHCLYYWLSTTGTIEQKVVETVMSGVDINKEKLDEWARLREIK